jgi:hypothetical protein
MLRLCKFAIAVAALTQVVVAAAAQDAICGPGGCVAVGPVHFPKRLHNFRPRPRDGLPMMDDFHTDPTDFHGAACIWTWRPVATPAGPAWGLGRECWRY